VGEQGTAEDRSKLRTLDQAIAAAEKLHMDGVGFAFLPGDGLIGIDIDGAIDAETGEIAERARAIIEACSSYTEYSPSGKGVHIIVAGETSTFKSNKIGLEVFCGSQFFTFTGRRYSGTPEDVRRSTRPR
jgi:putative DNA primase/helicase